MAIYSTFFLCEPPQLSSGFTGWKLPRSVAVTRKTINPFTKEEMTISSYEPEWDDNLGETEVPDYGIVSVVGDYETYLESRIPPFVRAQPHWCAKNLTSVELEPLLEAVLESDDAKLETALYANPTLSAGMEKRPDLFAARMKAIDESILRLIAQKWAALMSTPDFTHTEDGERIEEDWTVDDAMTIVQPLAKLAKLCSKQSIYLLSEW